MPRTTKMQEFNNWIKGLPVQMFKVEFKWEPANKNVAIIARSIEDAERLCKIEYPAATLIQHLGTIDKVFASL